MSLPYIRPPPHHREEVQLRISDRLHPLSLTTTPAPTATSTVFLKIKLGHFQAQIPPMTFHCMLSKIQFSFCGISGTSQFSLISFSTICPSHTDSLPRTEKHPSAPAHASPCKPGVRPSPASQPRKLLLIPQNPAQISPPL